MSRFERAAVELAARGYFVFPVRERGKDPLTKNGFTDATRDERTILKWWDRWPRANVGVACETSGIAVLDIDAKHGADPEEEIPELGLELAPSVRTGEAPEPDEEHPDSLAGVRGAHVLFAGNIATGGTTRAGVEVRGIGSYVVAPPSVHPSGVPYEGSYPPVAALPPMPEPVAALLRSRNGNGAAPPVPDVIGENRNITLTSLAGTCRRRGMSEAAILAALREENREKCRPPLSDDELAKIAKSVAKYKPAPGHREPSDLSDLTVPDWLQTELEQAGVSEEDIEGAKSLNDLIKLLGGKTNTATEIVQLVEEAGAVLFHDAEQAAFVSFDVDGHQETWPVKSRAVRLYAQRLYWRQKNSAPPAQALSDALGVLEGKALFDGRELPVYFRLAGEGHEIVIDLGDREWHSVRITRDGWTVLDHHPVRFRRTKAMAALPTPERGGGLDLLRPFVNVADDDAWRLVVGWLLAALRPSYPYPVLVAHGEQGSAKSTLGRVLRALVDPNASPLRVAPHDAVDLMVTATSSWVVAYDNISRIPPSLSDALCRLSTGGGLSKRELYSDGDEFILDAMRPAIINGIDEVVNRSDLLDRAVLVELPIIAEKNRMPEEEFWARFDAVHAQILGALCDTLASALARVDDIELERLPRMADFALWVTAAEPALGWEPGAFMGSYSENRGAAHDIAVGASPIGAALIALAEEGYSDTPSALLAELGTKVNEKLTKDKDWPQTARALTAELKRLAPNLRELGYAVVRWKTSDSTHARMVTLKKVDE